MVVMYDAKTLNKKIAQFHGVREKLLEVQTKVAANVEAELAKHTKTGKIHVELSHGDVDLYVSLVDDDPDGDVMAFEYGHYSGKTGDADRKVVRGAKVLAAGMLVGV